MRHLLFAFLTVVIVLTSCDLIIEYQTSQHSTIKYDCGMSEWHPDIPPSAKETCRQQRTPGKNYASIMG